MGVWNVLGPCRITGTKTSLAHLHFFNNAGESDARDSPRPGGGRDGWGGCLKDTSVSSADCLIEQGWSGSKESYYPSFFSSLIPLMVFITLSPFWWVGSCWANMFWLENEFFLLRLPNPFLWVCSQMLLLPILKCHQVAKAPLQNTKGKEVWLSRNDQGQRRRKGHLVACFNTVNSTDLGFFNGRFLICDCAQWKFDHFFQTLQSAPLPQSMIIKEKSFLALVSMAK